MEIGSVSGIKILVCWLMTLWHINPCGLFLSKSCFYLHMIWKQIVCGLISRVFSNGPGDRGSIPGRVILKTKKVVLDAALLSTQHYKIAIKGKVEKSRERSSALPYTWLSVVPVV